MSNNSRLEKESEVWRRSIVVLYDVMRIRWKILRIWRKRRIFSTRRSGCYVPILLVPAEGWGPFGPLGALRALLGAFGPQ